MIHLKIKYAYGGHTSWKNTSLTRITAFGTNSKATISSLVWCWKKWLSSGKLSSYLAEVDNRAKVMLDLLVKQMAEKQGITEQLKAQDQMAWVRRMNNIHNAAEEIILQELIYEEDAV